MAVPTSEECFMIPAAGSRQSFERGQFVSHPGWYISFQQIPPYVAPIWHSWWIPQLMRSHFRERPKCAGPDIPCKTSHTNRDIKYAATCVRTNKFLSCDFLVLKADNFVKCRMIRTSASAEERKSHTEIATRRKNTAVKEIHEVTTNTYSSSGGAIDHEKCAGWNTYNNTIGFIRRIGRPQNQTFAIRKSESIWHAS